MSVKSSTMDYLGTKKCFVCFAKTEKNNFIPLDPSYKVFDSCFQFLHAAIAKDNQQKNRTETSLCKKCFNCAIELTHLQEQLTNLQKKISDLTVAFSLSVLHRRSQAKKNGEKDLRQKSTKQIIELDVTDLPQILLSIDVLDSETTSNIEEEDQNSCSNSCGLPIMKNDAISDTSLLLNDSEEVENEDLFTNFFTGDDRNELVLPHNNIDPLDNEIKIVPDSLDEVLDSNIEEVQVKQPIPFPVESISINSTKIKSDTNLGPIDLETGGNFGGSVTTNATGQFYFNDSHNDQDMCFPNLHEVIAKQTILKSRMKRKRVTLQRKEASKYHKKANSGKYVCPICHMGFKAKPNLSRHIRTHTGFKPHTCSYCTLTFSRLEHVRSHERRIHTGEKPYKCLYCDQTFFASCERNLHNRSCHSSELSKTGTGIGIQNTRKKKRSKTT